MSTPDTIRDVINLWPSRKALADEIGVDVARVHKWAQASAIPARFHQSVVLAAQRADLPVTAEIIVALHASEAHAGAEVLPS